MKTKYIFAACAVIYLVWNLLYLDKYPLLDLDDVWMSDPSWQFVKHGNFSNPICEGFYGLEKNDIYHGRLYYLSQALVFWLFGLGPYQARVPSLIFAVLVVMLTYLVGKKLFDEKIAAMSSVLLAISGIFVICSHRGRQDIMLAAFLLGCVYLFLLAKERNSAGFLFFSGLVAGFSIDVHMNGVILYALVPVMFVFERRSFSSSGKIYAAILGIVVGFFWWAGTHVLPDYRLFFYQWKGIVSNDFPTPVRLTLNPFTLLKMELGRYKAWFWGAAYHRNMIEFVLILAGVLAAGRKRFSNARIPLLVFSVIFVVMALFVAQKSPYYLIFIYPFLIMMFSQSVVEAKKNLGTIFLVLLCGFYLIQIGYISAKYRDVDYWRYFQNVKKYVPENSVVFGDAVLWFGFREKYYADFAYGCYAKTNEKKDVASFIKSKGIDYVVFGDKYLELYMKDEFREPKYRLAGTVEDKYFGSNAMLGKEKSFQTRIYKVEEK